MDNDKLIAEWLDAKIQMMLADLPGQSGFVADTTKAMIATTQAIKGGIERGEHLKEER
jgi:hypothetical protein